MNRKEIVEFVEKTYGIEKINQKKQKIELLSPEIYNQILNDTNFLDENCKFSERWFCFKNNLLAKPTCHVCGKSVNFNNVNTGYSKYCSSACVSRCPDIKEKMKKTWMDKYGVPNPSYSKEIKEKKKKTNLERFGCECSFQSEIVKEKMKETSRQRYGTEFACQHESIKERIKETNLEKYGAIAPIMNPEIQQRLQKTNLDRYGHTCSLHGKEQEKKTEKTNIEKFGYKYPMKNKDVVKKQQETLMKKYGVIAAMQHNDFKLKIKNTLMKNYGVTSPLNNPEIQQRLQKTNLERYGHTCCLQGETVKEKSKKTNLEKYGFESALASPVIKRKIQKIRRNNMFNKINILMSSMNLEYLDDFYNDCYEKHTFKCTTCGTEFKHSWNCVQQGYQCPKCFPRPMGTSKGERDLADFIKSLGIEVVSNSKKIIPPKEIDIFIPSMNIAIEYNGLYWHSEAVINDSKYHLNKTNLCEENGIRLIHIFEDEWIFKQDIVKNRLKQILNVKQDRKVIYARKCIIKPIPCNLKNQFLDTYHIQGKDISKVYFGAYYENELVSVMTFSHGNISKGSIKKDTIWELNRFCSKDDYIIPGIASKLLKHFQRHYEWQEIFSYADRRWSQGNVYTKLGFEFMHYTSVNYWYIRDFERVHRFNLRKRPDEPKDKTEFELREEEGYVRVYDCGSIKYKMSNPNYQGQLTF